MEEDDYGYVVNHRGIEIFDEIMYLNYWYGIEDEKKKEVNTL